MSESAKTLSMIGAAALLILLAVVTRPQQPTATDEGTENQSLFPEWKEPTAARSLEITSIDESLGTPKDFKVAEVNGRWVIPSHSNYPANAEQNVVNAAGALINLKVLSVVSDNNGDQSIYGVVEPDITKVGPGSVGVGKMIVVQDGSGKDLARLIVGKEDKNASADSPGNLRFVRKAGQDRIYRVALDTAPFSTKFQDWIDPDLLDLKKQWDINQLAFRDYTIEGELIRKWDASLAFDVAKSAWTVKDLTNYKDNKPSPGKLSSDQELDSAKLNEIKMDASGLKITDVLPKPEALSSKLKSGKPYLNDEKSAQMLAQAGFVPFPLRDPNDLLAMGGDMTIGMKDGVEYAVHFGKSAFSFKSDSDKDTKAKGDKGKDKNDKTKPGASEKESKGTKTELVRVVFVTTRFDQSLIPKPELEPLPGAKKPEDTKPEPKKPETKTPDAKPADAKPADTKTDDKKPEDKKPDEKKSGDKSAAIGRHSEELLALADPVPGSDNKTPDEKAPEKKSGDVKPEEKKPDDKKPDAKPVDDKKPADEKKPDDKKPTDDKTKPAEPANTQPNDIKRAEEEQRLDAERKRIETENRGKQDQYDQAVKAGKARAKELNSRFADWFYLITEDDYKKLHVNLNDIIKTKPGAGPTLGPGLKDPFNGGLPPSGLPGPNN